MLLPFLCQTRANVKAERHTPTHREVLQCLRSPDPAGVPIHDPVLVCTLPFFDPEVGGGFEHSRDVNSAIRNCFGHSTKFGKGSLNCSGHFSNTFFLTPDSTVLELFRQFLRFYRNEPCS